jgi:protein-S-isoprenylcysteine O-methyltransferase Ste14
MSTLVIVLRVFSVLVFAVPMLLAAGVRREDPNGHARQRGGARAPLIANLASVGLYLPSLLVFSSAPERPMSALLASLGSLLALSGAALVLRSRAELGRAWSLAPQADRGTGFVATGPYRLVRHPIYLGFVLLALGQALAFGSWPAVLIVLCGLIPTFAWRAGAEEKLLSGTFGEPYAAYRRRTRMILPYLL